MVASVYISDVPGAFGSRFLLPGSVALLSPVGSAHVYGECNPSLIIVTNIQTHKSMITVCVFVIAKDAYPFPEIYRNIIMSRRT